MFSKPGLRIELDLQASVDEQADLRIRVPNGDIPAECSCCGEKA
jgi:hypothetical protein